MLGGLVALYGPPDAAAIDAYVSGSGRAAPLVAVAGSAVLTCAMVPRTVLAFVGGLLFGTLAGGLYVLVGALLGAAVAFGAGRVLGRDFVLARSASRAEGRIARLDAWLGRRGVFGVLAVRLVPLAPYGLMSYAFGTTGTRFRDFLAGSALGATPTSLGYAAVGAAALTASPTALAVGAGALGLLMLAGTWAAGWARTRLGVPGTPPAPAGAGVTPVTPAGTPPRP
ncbi:TVP38/TMEM64 family protein [Longispora fulva]|nr:TVP38/TMEM64 family protein [Longispora fulva]